eukprot:4682940-Alexandrium_andersonii.AAC.1
MKHGGRARGPSWLRGRRGRSHLQTRPRRLRGTVVAEGGSVCGWLRADLKLPSEQSARCEDRLETPLRIWIARARFLQEGGGRTRTRS